MQIRGVGMVRIVLMLDLPMSSQSSLGKRRESQVGLCSKSGVQCLYVELGSCDWPCSDIISKLE